MKQYAKVFRSTRIFFPERSNLGRYVYIGPNCMINAEGGLRVGNGGILGPEVVILTSSHDYRSGDILPYDVFDVHRPVDIGAGVWIGYRAMIAPGVTIGDGAIVGMGAVVVSDVDAGAVVAGNPATCVSQRDVAEIFGKVEREAFFVQKYWSALPARQKSNRK